MKLTECHTALSGGRIIDPRNYVSELSLSPYCPSRIGDNDDELCKLIRYISDKYPRFILVGDFNVSDIEWDNWTAVHNNPSSLKFLNTLQDNFLLQYIDTPTRGRGSDIPRILDLVISNTEIVTSIEYLAPLGKVIILYW